MKVQDLVATGVVEGASGAASLLRHLVGDGDGHGDRRTDRWHAVTIYRSEQDVMPEGRLPDPLAELADEIEFRIRPAPGDKGTEIHARVRGPVPTGVAEAAARIAGKDPRQALRRALREAKCLLETGEILQPDRQRTARTTVTNIPLALASRHGRDEGRL